MGYVLSTRDMIHRYGHLGYRYGIWANEVGHDSIDTVISHIDMGYLVTLVVESTQGQRRDNIHGVNTGTSCTE